ncbi:hypothetical protein CSB09_03465 [Candidatus Gracilibacteria bacterium]|nr:MAG: hypothetical protein CSB09_03465 [Candidatus Gracilibacteria bacterium]
MKWFSHGVLGKNARNLKYIRTKNKGKYTKLADNKLKTKEFLSPRGIPFAKNYAIIKTHQELKKFSLDSIDEDSFVIKPNMGSKGKGILVVKKTKKGEYISGGHEWSVEDLELHMLDILQGAFSLHGRDTIIIEEMLRPGKEFEKYCRHGLADIRLIICNYVPLTAMVRMPTVSSDGKANLALGGIGLGIDIATGNIISFFQNNKSYTGFFPKEYEFLQGSSLPYWDNILLFSSQIQYHTNLGYLALDWVITKDGPKLLEINARGGLEIQNINLVPLAARLAQIEKLKVTSPEKGVELAKSLFHRETMSSLGGKHILALSQKISLNGQEVDLRVNINKLQTQISEDLRKRFGDEFLVKLPKGGQLRIKSQSTLKNEKQTIILGQDSLKNCLIDPRRVSYITPKPAKWSDPLLNLDKNISNLGKKISISRVLRPINYFQEQDNFLADPFYYNPNFEYKRYTPKQIEIFKEGIKKVHEQLQERNIQSEPLFPLYEEKLREIEERLFFIEAYQMQDYPKMQQANRYLFGAFDEENLALSKKITFSHKKSGPKERKAMLGKILTIDEIMQHIHNYFKKYTIQEIPIKISTHTLSRIAISYKKEQPIINISHMASIREKEMQAILDHEIGTHLRRYLAGEKEGLDLLKKGTGYYISDEEGFAIYNSLLSLPEKYQKNTMYLNYFILTQIDTLSFVESAGLIKSIFPHKNFAEIFTHTLRLKRGICDGSAKTPGTTYWKDKIYVDGYIRTKKWIDDGGDTSKLFKGKIKISDLEILDTL